MPIVSSYEIHRGRDSEMAKTGTGRATITMIDTNGSLDPASGSASYHPLTPVAIGLTNPVTGGSSPIFVGNVAKWSYKMYPTERYGIATIECVDAIDIFEATKMQSSPVGGAAAFGDVIASTNEGNIVFYEDDQVNYRINQVLDQLGWPAGPREIFTGNVRLKETVYAPATNSALTAIQDAADAEFPGIANFYIQKNGTPTFHGRLARFNPTSAQYHITTWKVGDVAAANADSSYALIFDLDYDEDKDRIINSASAMPEGIADSAIPGQLVEDAASIAEYGTRSPWSAENLLTDHGWLTGYNANDETKAFARYYVDNYAEPEVRINRIRFQRIDKNSAYGAAEWALLCGIDISDRLQVKTTHHGGAGGFNNALYFVEGLHYSARPLNAEMLDVTLDIDVTPATYYAIPPS